MMKNFENPLRFDKVMVASLVAYFFWPTLYVHNNATLICLCVIALSSRLPVFSVIYLRNSLA